MKNVPIMYVCCYVHWEARFAIAFSASFAGMFFLQRSYSVQEGPMETEVVVLIRTWNRTFKTCISTIPSYFQCRIQWVCQTGSALLFTEKICTSSPPFLKSRMLNDLLWGIIRTGEISMATTNLSLFKLAK